MNILLKVDKLLNSINTIIFIIVMELLLFIPSILVNVILHLLGFNGDVGGPKAITKLTIIPLIIVTSIIVPIIETFIFQFGIIRILEKFEITKNKPVFMILISAIVFSLNHTYSYAYILDTFLVGVLLAYSFLIYANKNKNPFLVVCVIHSVRNLIITVFSLFL